MAARSTPPMPSTITQLDGQHAGMTHDVIFFPDNGAAITVASDKALLCWLRRDDGSYWPSVHKNLADNGHTLLYWAPTRSLFVGTENGLITEVEVAEDFNSLTYKQSFQAHGGAVTSMIFLPKLNILLSGSRDATVAVIDWAKQQRVHAIKRNRDVSAICFDEATSTLMVADHSGEIGVLKLNDEHKLEPVTLLEKHKGAIFALLWSPEDKVLFSAGADKTIVRWDVGGGEGKHCILSAHHDKVIALRYEPESKQLLSVGDGGTLVVWDLHGDFEAPPEWKSGDVCAICDKPFFWNAGKMWERKQLSLRRQHHCRHCGEAVCDDCSKHRLAYPKMGFELTVRFCDACKKSTEDDDFTHRARVFQTSPMSRIHFVDPTLAGICRGDTITIVDLDQLLRQPDNGLLANHAAKVKPRTSSFAKTKPRKAAPASSSGNPAIATAMDKGQPRRKGWNEIRFGRFFKRFGTNNLCGRRISLRLHLDSM